MAVITLTTDFGGTDYFVGAMKGIIFQIAPQSTVVDITHDISARDILSGAMVLREIWRTFPPGTIHIGVIDPGVGSDRSVILAQYANHFFLVPDNGLITLVHRMYRPEQVNLVTNKSLFCQPISPTFHGRDIFAPVAAHLAKGIKPDQVGPRMEIIRLLDIPIAQISTDGKLVGQVIHIDRFGNLVTNISADELSKFSKSAHNLNIYLEGHLIGPVCGTFSDVQAHQPLAYIGSAGQLEIAVNQARADLVFKATLNNKVEVG